MIYLALYKGKSQNWKKRLVDKAIRWATKGKYSHCEIAIEKRLSHTGERYPDIVFDCYSASLRDGGVRHKRMDVRNEKWDLIPLAHLQAPQIEAYFAKTKGAKYDLFGAIGIVLPIKHSKSKYFCSEWCAEVIGFHCPNEFSPEKLHRKLRDLG